MQSGFEGRPWGALYYLNEAIRPDPSDVSALARRGIVLSRTGDLDGAIRDLRQAINLSNWGENCKPPSYARRLLGRALIKKGRKDVSIGLYGGPSEKEPEKRYILRSHDLIEAGNVDEAIKDLVTAIKSARDDEQKAKVWVMLGDLLTVKSPPDTVKSPPDDALNAYAMGRLLDPASSRPHVRRGLIRAYDGDLDGGLKDLGKANDLEPPWDSNVLSHFGAVHALKGEFGEAKRLLDMAVKGNYKDPQIHLWRAIALVFEDNNKIDYEGDKKEEEKWHAPARIEFRELMSLDFSSPLPMSNLGVTLAWKGDLKGAKWALEKAIEENPRDSRALRYLGAVLALMDKHDRALCELKKAVSQDRRDAHAKALIGAVLALKGEQNEALRMVNEAFTLNSQDPRVRSLRGGVLALGGQKNEAIRELGAAIRLDRRDSWTYALRDALQPSSGSAVEAEDCKRAQRYAIMGERVEYHDEPLDAISDDIAVNHASESSRTGGASEPPQPIVGKILKKMLIAKEREVFHPDYFSKRSRRIQDWSFANFAETA